MRSGAHWVPIIKKNIRKAMVGESKPVKDRGRVSQLCSSQNKGIGAKTKQRNDEGNAKGQPLLARKDTHHETGGGWSHKKDAEGGKCVVRQRKIGGRAHGWSRGAIENHVGNVQEGQEKQPLQKTVGHNRISQTQKQKKSKTDRKNQTEKGQHREERNGE